MTKEEFLKQATAAALASSAWSGLLAGVTVAQAALESRFGESRLSQIADNFFGIKATRDHPFVEMPTLEVVEDKTIRVNARFARFDSMAACFEYRDRLVLRSPLYAEARACARDAERFARALSRVWATDPRNSEKILGIYRQYKLDSLDAGKETAPQAAGPWEKTSS